MNRRTAVGVLGSLAFGTVAAAWGRSALAQPVCTLTPEQIEGPFYLDQARMRDAISEGKPGVPLQLILRVLEASASCAPIPKAAVDVWQCDALGIYSGYEGAAIAPRHVEPVDDKTFLRGTQLTDAAGAVRFRTIYPGWYSGRTPHVHLKLRVGAKAVTTQLYFPDPFLDQLFTDVEPYRSHIMMTAPGLPKSYPRVRNADDRLFLVDASKPMPVERVNGVLTAKATIGMISQGNRGIAPLFK